MAPSQHAQLAVLHSLISLADDSPGPHLGAGVQLAEAWHGAGLVLAVVAHSADGVGQRDGAHWGVVEGVERLRGLSLQPCNTPDTSDTGHYMYVNTRG